METAIKCPPTPQRLAFDPVCGSPQIAAVPPAARHGVAEGLRAEAIERLRKALTPLAGPDVSLCRIAAERGIFCRGFRRRPTAEFDRRWRKAIRRSTHLTRDRMEKFADLWQLIEQFRCGVPLACDAAGPGSPCRGWDEFSDEQLAQFCRELTEVRPHELPISGESD